MTDLKFRYSADQSHQLEALNAVCDLFRGQEFYDSRFTVDADRPGDLQLDVPVTPGYANGLRISERQLEQNLHAVQENNNLPPTRDLTDGRLRDFTVEMETGTGKTYVYTRTIYELNKRYGLTKFVIVVPSVAIREGVKKSFESTKEHFNTLYDGASLDSFMYDSNNLGNVYNFAVSSSIQVMIINIAAFNKEIEDDEKKGVTNIFYRPSEKLIGGSSPQELVSQCRPIVIIDEPQSVDNSAKAKTAIRNLNPLFVLRYSATHKQILNMVYRLGPVEAFQQNLVKGIVVDSVQSGADMNGSYVRLDSVDASNGFSAHVTIDVRKKRGVGQDRKRVKVRTGNDLYQKSNENADYEGGWIVQNIGADPGNEFVLFQNGTYLELGEAVGDVAAEAVKRAQIARTIEDHLDRQLRLYHEHIKVLSLFFIDKVEKYRLYEPEVHNGEYADIFEEEYRKIANREDWVRRYEKAGVPLPRDPRPLHQGYFAADGKGKFKNSRGSANTSADTSAFELIMRKKETLVSLPDGKDPDKDVSFIFSHSALKEGWDNPNVFQICTLVETKDTLTKRQKIGRGLRLPVNQDGERCLDPKVNELTVISNESYDEFARGLQKEFEDEGVKFGILTPQSFTNLILRDSNGNEERCGYERSNELFTSLVDSGLVTEKGEITPDLKLAAEQENVPLPAELERIDDMQEQVSGIILHKAQKLQIRDKKNEVTVELEKDVTADPAFQALWERIRQTTRFEMHIDTEELIAKAVEGIRRMPAIRPVELMASRAGINIDDTGVGVDADSIHTSLVNVDGVRSYDLPDPISELQDAVGLTRSTIARILQESDYYEQFRTDPMTYLTQVAAKIEEAKTDVVTKGIKYTRLPESQWYTMDILAVSDLRAYLGQNAWRPANHKSLYSYVVYDSSTVEQPYAVALDRADMVKVFAKLPDKFKIDTPLGSYNPDWAYVEEVDGHERVYFVTETKGKPRGMNRRAEEMKINCAEKHFEALNLGAEFHYGVEVKYHYDCSAA